MKTFLFASVDKEAVNDALSNLITSQRVFEKGESIYSPYSKSKEIGIVLSGRCDIWQKRDTTEDVLLNSVVKGGILGILTVFSDSEQFPTHVVASKRTEILFISERSFLSLIRSNIDISINVIYFLANRISFLNDKIDTFSCQTAEQKLANYCLLCYQKTGAPSISISKSALSRVLGIGRASLYRAIDSLIEQDAINCLSKEIIIKNIDILERISK